MKKILSLFLFMSLALAIGASPVSPSVARRVAHSFIATTLRQPYSEQQFLDVSAQCGIPQLYVFDIAKGKAFVIVAADDRVLPILGYSAANGLVAADLPSHVREWLADYAVQIDYAVAHDLAATPEAVSQWSMLLRNQVLEAFAPNHPVNASMQPMLTTTWNQSPRYNDLCPFDASQNARSVTGCVATAMSQVMRYWSYPAQGVGSHSYTHSTYGSLSANFGATSYDWANMPASLSASSTQQQISAVATLCYHAGVAVNMDYSPSGSGASTIGSGNTAENALRTYFDYSSSLHGMYKSSVSSDSAWVALCKADLSAGRPLIYRGSGSSGGHCWVCDGFNAADYLHFNWGWGGSSDGYFPVSSLSPGYDFTTSQGAIFGIEPSFTSGAAVRNMALDGVSSQSATIRWTDPNVPHATRYRFRYAPSASFSAANPATYILDSCTSQSASLSGLAPSTTYTIEVCAVAPGYVSAWTAFQFRTDCGAIAHSALPYSYGFEDATSSGASGEIHSCYRRFSNSTTAYPYPTSTYHASGSYGLLFYATSSSYSYLVLPIFADSVNTLQVSFDIRQYSASNAAPLRVGVIDDPFDVGSFFELDCISAASTSWTTVHVPLTAYRGSATHIALLCDAAGYVPIDNLVVEEAPSCVSPNRIRLLRSSSQSLSLSWSNRSRTTPMAYQLAYGVAGTPLSACSTMVLSQPAATLSGLLPGTDYDVYLRAICSVADTGVWSSASTFVTRCQGTPLPFAENFDSYTGTPYNAVGTMPSCWRSYSNGTNAAYLPHVIGGSGSYSYFRGSSALVLTSGSSQYGSNHLVRLPEFDQPLRNLTMRYWLCTESASSGSLSVGYLTSDDTASFVPIKIVPASNLTMHSGNGLQASAGFFDTVSFASASADAQFIAFRWYYGSSYYTCCIDDISVTSNGCAPISVTPTAPFVEDFESAPTCWGNCLESGSTLWAASAGSHYSSHSAYSGSSNMLLYVANTLGNVATLVTPVLDLSSCASAYLRFAHLQKKWSNDQDTLCVLYHTSPSVPWIPLVSYTGDIASWQVDSIALPVVGSTVEVAFRANARYGYGVAIDKVEVVGRNRNTYAVVLTSSDTLMGSVSGAGIYAQDSVAILTATARYGYHFAGWSDADTTNPRSVAVTSDTAFTALFAPDQFLVTLTTSDTSMGSFVGAGLHDYRSVVLIQAVPAPHHLFVRWSDGSTQPTRELLIESDVALSATFMRDCSGSRVVDSAEACDHYLWRNTNYLNSGSYTKTASGFCDSVFILNLTIHHSTTDTLSVVSAMPYEWHDSLISSPGTYVWIGTTTYGCDSTMVLLLSAPEGLSAPEHASLSLYPNPTTGSVVVESDKPIESLTVFDIAGRVLFHTEPHATHAAVSLAALPQGSYVVRLVAAANTHVCKLIIKH